MAYASKNSLITSEWNQMFKENVIQNCKNSLHFLKNLTVMAVNTILYSKKFFHHDNYTFLPFGNTKIPTLKNNCTDEYAEIFKSSLENALVALDKNYLDKLALNLYDAKSKEKHLVEFHVFEFNYKSCETKTTHINGKNRRCSSISPKHVQEQTLQLLQSIINFLQSNAGLPIKHYDLSIRLYYNGDAPDGYQAPGYTGELIDQGTIEEHLLYYIENARTLGTVRTRHHTMTTRSLARDVALSQNMSAIKLDNMDIADVDESSSHLRIKCSCRIEDAPTNFALLKCQYCKCQQHAVCYGYATEMVTNLPNHCCVGCYDEDKTRTPTDTELAAYTENKRFTLTLVRYALKCSLDMSTIGSEDFVRMMNLSEMYASAIMGQFFRWGIVAEDPNKTTARQSIIKKKQLEAIEEVFEQDDDEAASESRPAGWGAVRAVSAEAASEMARRARGAPHGSMHEYVQALPACEQRSPSITRPTTRKRTRNLSFYNKGKD